MMDGGCRSFTQCFFVLHNGVGLMIVDIHLKSLPDALDNLRDDLISCINSTFSHIGYGFNKTAT